MAESGNEPRDSHSLTRTSSSTASEIDSVTSEIDSKIMDNLQEVVTDTDDTVPRQRCEVCGETASGNFFGALVCLPCKSFFIRCTKEGDPMFVSQCDRTCDISKQGRNRCQYCRYKRCIEAGMARKEKPECVEPIEGQILCRVCQDIANGIHFGVHTCEGCKKFFRRGLVENQSYVCKDKKTCTMNPKNRNNCRYCRYRKCLEVGMSRRAIKMGRPKKLNNDFESSEITPELDSMDHKDNKMAAPNATVKIKQTVPLTVSSSCFPNSCYLGQMINAECSSQSGHLVQEDDESSQSVQLTQRDNSSESGQLVQTDESSQLGKLLQGDGNNQLVDLVQEDYSGHYRQVIHKGDSRESGHRGQNNTSVKVSNKSILRNVLIFQDDTRDIDNYTIGSSTCMNEDIRDTDNHTIGSSTCMNEDTREIDKLISGSLTCMNEANKTSGIVVDHIQESINMSSFYNSSKEVFSTLFQKAYVKPESITCSHLPVSNLSIPFNDTHPSNVYTDDSMSIPMSPSGALDLSVPSQHVYNQNCPSESCQNIPETSNQKLPLSSCPVAVHSSEQKISHLKEEKTSSPATCPFYNTDSDKHVPLHSHVPFHKNQAELSVKITHINGTHLPLSQKRPHPMPILLGEKKQRTFKACALSDSTSITSQTYKLEFPKREFTIKSFQGHEEQHLEHFKKHLQQYRPPVSASGCRYIDGESEQNMFIRQSCNITEYDIIHPDRQYLDRRSSLSIQDHHQTSLSNHCNILYKEVNGKNHPFHTHGKTDNVCFSFKGENPQNQHQHSQHDICSTLSPSDVRTNQAFSSMCCSESRPPEDLNNPTSIFEEANSSQQYGVLHHIADEDFAHRINEVFLPVCVILDHIYKERHICLKNMNLHLADTQITQIMRSMGYLSNTKKDNLSTAEQDMFSLTRYIFSALAEFIKPLDSFSLGLLVYDNQYCPARMCLYWTCPKQYPRQNQMTQDQHRVLQAMLEAYMIKLKNCDEGFLPEEGNPNYNEYLQEGDLSALTHVRRRMVRNTTEQMIFMSKVPGFTDFHPEDKVTIGKNATFANGLLNAAREWYDPERKTFRYFFNWEVLESNPLYDFRLKLLEIAEIIYGLDMDRTETAMMSALNVAAADFLDLQDPEKIEYARGFLTHALVAHLTYKAVDPTMRMQQLFRIMPQVRHIGIWHKQLRKIFVVPHDIPIVTAASPTGHG